MKKFVYCIGLLLTALCTTAMAQDDYNILKIEGMVPQTNGTTYYLKNVGTGLYVSYGGEWGKHCKESRAAHPFTVENNDNGLVALKSIAGYLESGTLWMDWAKETSKWTLQPVGGDYVNQYYLVGDNGRALTSVGNSAGVLGMAPLENKASQRWIFLTEAEIRSRMLKATKDKPFDATPLIKGAGFDLVDVESYLGQSWTNFDANKKLNPWHCGICPEDANEYNYCGIFNGGTNTFTITHNVTLPAGTYSYSFEGFYEYVKVTTEQDQTKGGRLDSWKNSGEARTISTTDNGSMTTTVTINGIKHTLPSYGNAIVYEPNYISSTVAAAEFRDKNKYKQNGTFYLNSAQSVSIVISKATTTSSSSSSEEVTGQGGSIIKYDNAKTVTTNSYPSQIFIDDFTLLYFGDEQLAEDEVSEDALKDSYVDANIDEAIDNMYPDATEEEKEQLKEEIKETINENTNNGNGSSDISDAIAGVENAVNDKQQEQEQEEAAGDVNVDENGNLVGDDSADLNCFIKNASFERSTSYGWTISSEGSSYTTGVKDNNLADYTTTGVDGEFLFHTSSQNVQLTQSINNLPNGVYKMTVSLASDAGNVISLIANGYEREVTMKAGTGTFEDFNIKFKVTDGTATIGVVSATWYKADNFRLEILNDHLILSETDKIMGGGNQARSIDYWYNTLTLYRTINANRNWNTFAVPFDIPVESLSGWEVKELTNSEIDENGNITLIFEDSEDGIKAGVPYIVRNTTMTEKLTEIPMTNVYVNITLNDVETDHVTFKGVYTNGTVPIGSYFINSNKFYRCVNADNPDKLKGYRAYIEPKESNEARSLGYRFASKEETEEGTTTIDNTMGGEATVVAIYTLGGVRINEMQQGVNILQMSDGSVVKVVIK